MSIVVEGYSGCGIKVVRAVPPVKGAEYVLEKTSSSASYVPRLHKQLDKQTEFAKLVRAADKNIHVPEILYRRTVSIDGEDGGPPQVQSLTVGMAFAHHTDCITFLGKASAKKIDNFVQLLMSVMRVNVEASPLTDVPATLLTEKLHDIGRVCKKNAILDPYNAQIMPVLDRLLQFYGSQLTHSFPVGRCHGDLTLSNLLVQEHEDDRLVLIDFLDSFIESPLADMAKICQDLYYGWTIRLLNRPYDRTRLFTIFRYIRDTMMKEFEDRPWFVMHFRPMLIINQLRVLQYSKNDEDAQYLLSTVLHQNGLWTPTPAS